MNERIRELYHQAHSVRNHDGDPALDGNPPTMYWQGEVSAQRFAELIVRKCTNMLPEDSIRNRDGVHMFYVIREHFGVECEQQIL